MAYVNVLEWKAEQVSEWLRGLDDSIFPYAHFFLNNNINGQGLLNLTVDDLYKLHVEKLGHQELILESLDLLKQLHFSLDQENLQYVSLKLSCKARSLYNEIQMRYPVAIPAATLGGGSTSSSNNNTPVKKQEITGAVMSQVGDVLDSVRCLLSWLERKPFDSKEEFYKVRTTLIGLSLELATNTHREAFAERPIDVIRDCCDKLGELSDQVIQEVRDPLLLQPASLDVATLRKKADEELGIVVECHTLGTHLVTEVNVINPSARIQTGDEIVQVNYQTVVGWQTKKVIQLMGENPGEVILTLKKRPKHGNLMGQVYMKPFWIPARNKRNNNLVFNNLPSPRTELLVVPDLSIPIPKKKTGGDSVSSCDEESHDISEEDALNHEEESDSENDEAFLPVVAAEVADQIEGRGKPGAPVSPTTSLRSVLSRPRSAPQRRATISGTMSRSRPNINVGESVCSGSGIDSSMLEISYSTLSSQDSGVSTMSAKQQEFTMRHHNNRGGNSHSAFNGCSAKVRPKTLAAPLSSAVLHQVTSAPNLHSINDSQRFVAQLDSSPDTSVGDTDALSDGEADAAILENVEYRNGSLNIEVKSPTSSISSPLRSLPPLPQTANNVSSSDRFNNSPQSLPPPGPSASTPPPMMDRVSGDRIVLKVPSPPNNGRRTSSSYMNVPHTSQIVPQTSSHPYVNITTDLVQSNPLPKPRTPKASPVLSAESRRRASSPPASATTPSRGSVGDDSASPPPATASANQSPASTGSRTGTRGKRPVPLPRRVSSSEINSHSNTLTTPPRAGGGMAGSQRQRSNTTSAGIAVSSSAASASVNHSSETSGGGAGRRGKSSQQSSHPSRDQGSTSPSVTAAQSSATSPSAGSGGSKRNKYAAESKEPTISRRSGSASRGSGREYGGGTVHGERDSTSVRGPLSPGSTSTRGPLSPGSSSSRGPLSPGSTSSRGPLPPGFTQITPTSSYKSYRRMPPAVPSVSSSSLQTAPGVRVSSVSGISSQVSGSSQTKISESQSSKASAAKLDAHRFRKTSSSSELQRSGSSGGQHQYKQQIHSQQGLPNHSKQGMPNHYNYKQPTGVPATRLDDQGYVEITEIVSPPVLCQGNNVTADKSPRKMSSSSRMTSVSSIDSGLPESISTSLPPTPKHCLPPPPVLPPAPTEPALPPTLPALPPRRHPSTSS